MFDASLRLVAVPDAISWNSSFLISLFMAEQASGLATDSRAGELRSQSVEVASKLCRRCDYARGSRDLLPF